MQREICKYCGKAMHLAKHISKDSPALSWERSNCPHTECRLNPLPVTPNWALIYRSFEIPDDLYEPLPLEADELPDDDNEG